MPIINRYRGTNPPVSDKEELLGRSFHFQELEEHIKNRRSVVVMGVEGIGKSSFLNCYFDLQYRRKMAVEKNTLIRVTDFPTDRDTDGVYMYLTDGVLKAVDMLNQYETKDIYLSLKEDCEKKINECRDAASKFQQACEVIQENGYNIMLVIDGFERFVSSPNVTMAHHNLMNNLISKNMSFVVTTNYDFNTDSLPENVSGSFLLMKFSGNEIKLKGLTEEECGLILHQDDFTSDEVHQLWILSGGIPYLLRKAAEYAFEYKYEEGDGQPRPITQAGWNEILQQTYLTVLPVLDRWCKWLSDDQIAVMNKIAESSSAQGVSFVYDAHKIAAQVLLDRGILVNPLEAATLRPLPGLYKFNTPLLLMYCKKNVLSSRQKANDDHEPQKKQEVQNQPAEEKKPQNDEETLDLIQKWAKENHYTVPVSFEQPLSDQLLAQYSLDRATLDNFDETVSKFIKTAILTDQTFLGVPMDDHTPAFIEFAKALECHLNCTILPVVKLIDPSYNHTQDRQPLSAKNKLMLGEFEYLLRYSYRFDTFTERASNYCANHQLAGYNKQWWERLMKSLNEGVTQITNGIAHSGGISQVRNDMAHAVRVSAETGEALCKTLFAGKRNIFKSCQSLHDEAVRRNLI